MIDIYIKSVTNGQTLRFVRYSRACRIAGGGQDDDREAENGVRRPLGSDQGRGSVCITRSRSDVGNVAF